jgi:hypothetical protein
MNKKMSHHIRIHINFLIIYNKLQKILPRNTLCPNPINEQKKSLGSHIQIVSLCKRTKNCFNLQSRTTNQFRSSI